MMTVAPPCWKRSGLEETGAASGREVERSNPLVPAAFRQGNPQFSPNAQMKVTRPSLYLMRPAGGVSAGCAPQGVVLLVKSRRGNSILPLVYTGPDNCPILLPCHRSGLMPVYAKASLN